MYNKIINPETGRQVSIYGKIGYKILKNYLNIDNPGTWYIQNLQNGVEDNHTYINGNISLNNTEGLPKQGWLRMEVET